SASAAHSAKSSCFFRRVLLNSDHSIFDLSAWRTMSQLDRNATDLRALVEQILFQFRKLDTAANGPHAALSCQELRLDEHLGDSGPRRMKELAEFLLLAVTSVTTIVDNLEKRGIVRRQRSEEDRRIVRVELTEVGRRASQAAVNEKLQLLRGML